MSRSRGAQDGNTNSMTHGLFHVRTALLELGVSPLDGRSAVAQALRDYREELVQDLGGDPSTAQSTLVDIVSRQKLLLDSIDTWLLQRPIMTMGSDGPALAPIMHQRELIASNLAKYLGLLGFQRHPKPIVSLGEYLEVKSTTEKAEAAK